MHPLFLFGLCSVSAFPYTLDKLVPKLAMPVGSSIAWSMASNLMALCHPTKPLETTLSVLFSPRQVLESMYPEQSLWIWSLLLLMRSALELTVNCSILSSWCLARKMRPTIMHEDTTPLERRSLTWFWTELGSWPTNALACKDFCFSTLLEVAPDLDSLLFWWKDFQWIMAKSLNWNSLFILHPKWLPLLWNLIIPSWPLTLLWNTPTAHSWLTTRPSMTFARGILTLIDPLTPTSTGSLDRLSPPSLLPSGLMAHST